MSAARYADTVADTQRVGRAEHERSYPERLYRSLSLAIDQACDQVEHVNLRGGGACPAAVGGFIEYLQLLAGEPGARPGTSAAAHEELFRLSSVLLGRPQADDEPEPEADVEAVMGRPALISALEAER
jgi:hypothetical protein